MKLTYLCKARSIYLLSFALVIGIVGIAAESGNMIQRTQSFTLFVRLLGSTMAVYACSRLIFDARVFFSKWELERIRAYDVILCSLLFVNFVLAGVLFGSVFASGDLVGSN